MLKRNKDYNWTNSSFPVYYPFVWVKSPILNWALYNQFTKFRLSPFDCRYPWKPSKKNLQQLWVLMLTSSLTTTIPKTLSNRFQPKMTLTQLPPFQTSTQTPATTMTSTVRQEKTGKIMKRSSSKSARRRSATRKRERKWLRKHSNQKPAPKMGASKQLL